MSQQPAEPSAEFRFAPDAKFPCILRMPIAFLIDRLLPADENPRVITALEYEQLKRQLDDGDTGNLQPVTFNVRTMQVIAGNQRVPAYDDLGVTETDVWCVDISPEAQRRAVLALNNHAGRYDENLLKAVIQAIEEDASAAGEDKDLALLATGFTAEELAAIVAEAKPSEGPKPPDKKAEARATLSDRFLIPPFSVLDARQGYWQSRKAGWIDLGLKGEEGRGGNLIGRSPQELFMFNTRIPYDEARKIVSEEMEKLGDKFDLMALIARYGGNPSTTGSTGEQKTGKTSAWLGRNSDGKSVTKREAHTGQTGKFLDKSGDGGRTFGQDLLRGENPELEPQRGVARRGGSLNINTQEWVQRKIAEGDISGGMAGNYTGTSIFDPVLCEVSYYWFCPAGGSVLDPFSGGSTRGAVAGCCGHAYTGVDLSERQINANRQQWPAIADAVRGIVPGVGQELSTVPEPVDPRWINGDSANVAELTGAEPESFDMIFSCPPYADLEVYSDHPADISNMSYEDFVPAYRKIIAAAVGMLKPNRFAVFVVGDLRDDKGFYRGFVGDTIEAFEDAGAKLYNELVLVTAIGSLPIRVGRQFSGYRKVGKTHQNVLVFFKGDPQTIKGWPQHKGQEITETAVDALMPQPKQEGGQDAPQAAVAVADAPIEQRAEESDPDALTPVQRVGEIWVKRDDLFACNGAPGGKVRSCLRLARRAQGQGKEGLVTAGSRSSPQVNIVARVGAALGMKVRCHTPTGKLSPEVEAAKLAGAEIVQHKAGYNNVIIARAREDAASRGWAEIPFGMECPEAIEETRRQVKVPEGAQRLIMPCGSGMSLAGVLRGLDDDGYGDLPVVAVVVGADPTERLDEYAPKNWRERVTLQPAGMDYHKAAPVTKLSGIELDPHYEAKCLPFIQPGDFFWCVGIRYTAIHPAGG